MMLTNTEMIAQLMEDQLIDETGRDISTILTCNESLEVLGHLADALYNYNSEIHIDIDGENGQDTIYLVSLNVYEDGESAFFIEPVETESGELKYGESEVFIMPKDSCSCLSGHYFSVWDWNQFVPLTEDTTLEELVNLITI